MRVMIAGGGTGGHLFPGLAVADEFRSRDASTEVVFVGTEYGIEARIVPREGFQIRFLRAEGLVGVSMVRKVKAAAKILLSVIDSYRIITSVRPDLVIGVGGYASGTTTLLAFFLSIPIRIQILKGSMGSAYKLFSLERGLFTIFSFGGSSGARSINRALVDALNHMRDLRDKIQFLHQTGPRDYENVRDAYRKAEFKGTIAPFIYQMGEAYAVADIVISRAGATTLAELTALGKASILIPYPYAAGNHQELNARKLREIGAAKMIPDRELNGETLARVIRELYEDEKMRADMERSSRAVGRPDACARVVDIAMSLIKQSATGSREVKGAK
jgi:UDP-N-acetylglucosamine--N-acetylmuramyl-(pentapeptide) pyrophosphoryl-undecaprenol N-acetylglucosamine transferase